MASGLGRWEQFAAENLDMKQLRYAAHGGNESICTLLLEHYASPKLKNAAGLTAEQDSSYLNGPKRFSTNVGKPHKIYIHGRLPHFEQAEHIPKLLHLFQEVQCHEFRKT
eukprot:389648-Amphidinium_carterae.1